MRQKQLCTTSHRPLYYLVSLSAVYKTSVFQPDRSTFFETLTCFAFFRNCLETSSQRRMNKCHITRVLKLHNETIPSTSRRKIIYIAIEKIPPPNEKVFSKPWNLFSKLWNSFSKLWNSFSKLWKVELYREEKTFPPRFRSFPIGEEYKLRTQWQNKASSIQLKSFYIFKSWKQWNIKKTVGIRRTLQCSLNTNRMAYFVLTTYYLALRPSI